MERKLRSVTALDDAAEAEQVLGLELDGATGDGGLGAGEPLAVQANVEHGNDEEGDA